MDGDQRQIIRNEEVVAAGQPEADQTVVSQTQRAVGNPPVAGVVSDRSTVQTSTTAETPPAEQVVQTTTTEASPPSEQVVAHNVAERVVDPAAERAAAVDWATRFVWFIVGLMAALIAIRFLLLLAGANENAGFAQLIYGLTGWMVAPFAGLFGAITYPGAAGTGVFEPGSLVAIVVYVLVGWGITKLAELMLGTNRTRGTVYQETERRTKL